MISPTETPPLTPQQEALFPQYIDQWTKIGLCTDKAERPRAEAAIRSMYRLHDYEEPKIVWTGSPLALSLLQAVVRSRYLDNQRGKKITAFAQERVKHHTRVSTLEWLKTRERGQKLLPKMPEAFEWIKTSEAGRQAAQQSLSMMCGVFDLTFTPYLWDKVWEKIGVPLTASLWRNIGSHIQDNITDLVTARGDRAAQSVRTIASENLGINLRNYDFKNYRGCLNSNMQETATHGCYGQFDAPWLAIYAFLYEVLGRPPLCKLHGLWELAKSAGWALPQTGICWISERPLLIARDTAGRLHSTSGPAIAYPDGWELYAVHGTLVPEHIIKTPSSITIESIDSETNVEIRRVMIGLYKEGIKSYLIDSGAQLIDQKADIHTALPIKLWRKTRRRDTPIVMVEMRNKTPEPDELGFPYHKSYFVRVPPDMTDALDAVAWHHSQTTSDYLQTQKGT